MALPARKTELRLVHDASPRGSSGAAGDPLPEDELVAGLRAGRDDARDAFYRAHAKDVWRILSKMLGHDHELEDLHHEVFLQAIRSVGRFQHQSSLRTWVYSVAVNCVRGRLRSRRRRRWLQFLAPEEVPEVVYDPDEEIAAQVQAVYALVDQLSANERIVFTLRFIEHMNAPEIAKVCDTSLGTVKRRLRRARRRFLRLAASDPVLCELCDREEAP